MTAKKILSRKLPGSCKVSDLGHERFELLQYFAAFARLCYNDTHAIQYCCLTALSNFLAVWTVLKRQVRFLLRRVQGSEGTSRHTTSLFVKLQWWTSHGVVGQICFSANKMGVVRLTSGWSFIAAFLRTMRGSDHHSLRRGPNTVSSVKCPLRRALRSASMTGLETCPKSARDVVLATIVHSASKCFLRTTSRPCSAPPWEHPLRSDRGILDREDKKTFLQSQLLSLKKGTWLAVTCCVDSVSTSAVSLSKFRMLTRGYRVSSS